MAFVYTFSRPPPHTGEICFRRRWYGRRGLLCRGEPLRRKRPAALFLFFEVGRLAFCFVDAGLAWVLAVVWRGGQTRSPCGDVCRHRRVLPLGRRSRGCVPDRCNFSDGLISSSPTSVSCGSPQSPVTAMRLRLILGLRRRAPVGVGGSWWSPAARCGGSRGPDVISAFLKGLFAKMALSSPLAAWISGEGHHSSPRQGGTEARDRILQSSRVRGSRRSGEREREAVTAEGERQAPMDQRQVVSENYANPITCFFHVLFKAASLAFYILFSLFVKSFVIIFVITVLLAALDFWVVKNVSGRILVGLRWWNEIDDEGNSVWKFECLDGESLARMNKKDSWLFWWTLYLTAAAWIVLGIFSLIRLEADYLLVVGVCLSLSIANIVGFTKCNKDAKKNIQAFAQNALASRVTSSLQSAFGVI